MPKDKSRDQRVHCGEPADREAEQLLAEQAAEQQAVIAPGTNGGLNDPIDDFPMLRDAGEPWAYGATNPKPNNRNLPVPFPLQAFESIRLNTDRRGYLVKG